MPPINSTKKRQEAQIRASTGAKHPLGEPSSTAPRRSARIAAKVQALPPESQSSRHLLPVRHPPKSARNSRIANSHNSGKAAAARKKTSRKSTSRKGRIIPSKTTLSFASKVKSNVKSKTEKSSAAHPLQNQASLGPPNKSVTTSKADPGPPAQVELPKEISDPTIRTWVNNLEQSEPLEQPETPSIHSSMAPNDPSLPSRQDSGVAPSPAPDPNTSQQTGTGTQSTKRPRGVSARAKLEKHFADRNIKDKPSVDNDEFARVIRTAISKSPGIGETQYAEICQLAEQFVDKSKYKRGHPATDWERWRSLTRFRQELNEMLPDSASFTHTPRDFKRDQVKSKTTTGNEAVFQRTVLISAIDRSRLRHSIFDYNCEGQWVLGENTQLPTTNKPSNGSKIPGPKPDLFVCFKFQSLIKQLPSGSDGIILENLYQCIHPDESRDRCFPFLLVEAKPRDESLAKATSSSIYAASQALYHIYCCMERARCLDKLKDVRTFSMSINASNLIVRSHQIQHNDYDQICFVHDIVMSGDSYNGHLLSTVVRSILRDYAEPKLFEILKDTYLELLRPQAEQLAGCKDRLENLLKQKKDQLDHSTDDESTRFSSGASAASTNVSAVVSHPPPAQSKIAEGTKRAKSNHKQRDSHHVPRHTRSRTNAAGNGILRSDTTGMSFDMSQAGI